MTITGHVWPFDGVDPQTGPDTYLNGARHGWPNDHSVDDTYECPPHTWFPSNKPEAQDAFREATRSEEIEQEYYATYGSKGEALLMLTATTYSQTAIATFDTYADAELAAKALNELKGY